MKSTHVKSARFVREASTLRQSNLNLAPTAHCQYRGLWLKPVIFAIFPMRSVLISFHWQPNDQEPGQSNHVFPEPPFPCARTTPGQSDEQLQGREWVLIERNVNYIYLFATYKALNP